MSDYTRLAHQAVTEGVNLKYVDRMRKALYAADAELTSLRAELEQARKERDEESEKVNHWMARHRDACAELEQARKDAQTCPHSKCDAQRYRDALERYSDPETWGEDDWGVKAVNILEYGDSGQIARDALAGDK